jgi:hypothetical protein
MGILALKFPCVVGESVYLYTNAVTKAKNFRHKVKDCRLSHVFSAACTRIAPTHTYEQTLEDTKLHNRGKVLSWIN